jgi:transcriptional regulator with XRE-family HTH domain
MTYICACEYIRKPMICVAELETLPVLTYHAGMAVDLAERIKALRLAMGKNQTEFAELIDSTQGTVARWESGSVPKHAALRKLAKLARQSVEDFVSGASFGEPDGDIPVVGYVGAGAAIYAFDDEPLGQGFDAVERPAFVKGGAVAVEVRGDSLFPVAEEGWRIVYTGEQTLVEEDVLNRLCVVRLLDGRTLVKRVLRGTKAQRYHLASTNAPMIEDAEIEWAARVKAIVPR